MLSKNKDYQMTKLLIQFDKENDLLDWEREENGDRDWETYFFCF